jgi:hypothetical protein
MKQKIKPYLPYLIITLVGLLIMSVVLPYYAFHWGVKPCTGMTTDAANCGDADVGGVGFILIGLPITLLGLIGLCVRWVIRRLRHKK